MCGSTLPSLVTCSVSSRDTSRDTRCRRAEIAWICWWRRWESKTSDFAPLEATTGNHRKADPELPESKHEEKHFRENALPTGKIEPEVTQGRADVGDMPTAETLGSLARKVLSRSRHADSRELARAVLRLLAQGRPDK